ncbi:TetR/AcrR family transcriptional regulator [Gordonia soli]|uniref:Putative TetR family transcriptional regulator n=1 Tax=Gordonia soli NBRC 108243 TaxID=1223545 RepID=M0QLP5_9ACTN|nr:TetR/AcrR family transcriptional regulator [Gordonia soli]GAC69226.1 putative TetR family transcriptional regulator [Gordonia soli NBRC 108243]
MAVNKVGRPSKAAERRAQIFGAVTDVIALEGLSALTTTSVAEAAGLKRTLVGHYFPSRDSLIEQYVSFAVGVYGEVMIERAAVGSVDEALHAMLDESAYPEPKYLTVWLDLVAASSRDPSIQTQLDWLWTELWLPKIRALIATEHPGAGREQLAGAAFCITALIEAYWAFRAQLTTGHVRRRRQVVAACHGILAQLD